MVYMATIREWLREKIIRYQSSRFERSDWLQRLSRPVLITYLSLSVLYFATYHLGLLTGVYMSTIMGGFMITLLILGFILVAHGTTVYGRRFAVLFVGLVITVAVLSILFLPRPQLP